MPYYFRCENCNEDVPVDVFSVGTHHRNCVRCGRSGCAECVHDGLCEDCYEDDEDNEEQD